MLQCKKLLYKDYSFWNKFGERTRYEKNILSADALEENKWYYCLIDGIYIIQVIAA